MTRTGDTLGYARVSTQDQDVSGQIARLKEAGAVRVFEDVVSGKQFDRPGLSALALETVLPSRGWIALVDRPRNCWKSSKT